jgi:hypothetical protein
MKRLLLWTFERGSFQWDIMCLLILAFLFLIPRDTFHDVPDFMKMPATGLVRTTQKDGNTIFTSKLHTPRFLDSDETRKVAVGMLEHTLGVSLDHPRVQPIRDWTGRVIGYAIWMKEKQP